MKRKTQYPNRLAVQRNRCPGRVLIALLLVLGLVATATQADIWKRVDKRGIVHLSDRPMGPGSVLILRSRKKASGRQPGYNPRQASALRKRYTPLIDTTADRYRMDKYLIHAVVQAESDYNPRAVSSKGAVGLMQLMPATARRYGVTDRRDPAQNLSGGIRYLRDLMRQFRNVSLALAAYNAGESAVKKYGHQIPPYPETRHYIRKVIRYYQQHRKPS